MSARWICLLFNISIIGAYILHSAPPASATVQVPQGESLPTSAVRTVPVDFASDIKQIKSDLQTIKERRRSFWDSDVWAPFAAALLAALGGWLTTLYVFRRSQVAQREALDRQAGERIEDNLFTALKLFGGGSQNRSLGLALMTAYWHTDLPAIQRAWKNVLVSQAIFLLTQSEERDNLLELENLRVIMNRLKERTRELSDGQRENLTGALDRAERAPRGKVTKEHPEGVPLGVTIDPRYLTAWRALLATGTE